MKVFCVDRCNYDVKREGSSLKTVENVHRYVHIYTGMNSFGSSITLHYNLQALQA